MAIFIDAGVLVADMNTRDINHERAAELMDMVLEGEFGSIYTSDYVVDESITATLARTNKHELAVKVGEYVLSSPRIKLLRVTGEVFDLAWEKFKSLKENPMSFTDCTTLALMEKGRIENLASFDSGFDGLVERIS